MNKTTKRFTVILGIIMSVAMVASLLIPLFSSQVGYTENLAEAERPTPLPEPTFPPPPDIASISFDETLLHPSGLFTMAVPTGWQSASHSNTVDELRAGLSNSAAHSVVETRIIKNQAGISDADALNAFFDEGWLSQTWRDYWDWEETSRKLTDDGRVVIDFNLSRSRSHFIARQVSWLENGDIYSARVVTAENAPAELKFLLDGVIQSMARLDAFPEAPFDWNAYFDNLDKHMIRFPSDWEVADAAAGLPATIIGDKAILVLETQDVALASDSDAIDWMTKWRDRVEPLTAEPIQVGESSGYQVSYRRSTLDGAPESGIALMLHGTDNRLHVANIRVGATDSDLLQLEADDFGVRAVLDTFRLLPGLDATTG